MFCKLESNNPNPNECGTYVEIINSDNCKSVPLYNVECFYQDMLDFISNKDYVDMCGMVKTIYYDYNGLEGVLTISEIDKEDIIEWENEHNQDILKFIS